MCLGESVVGLFIHIISIHVPSNLHIFSSRVHDGGSVSPQSDSVLYSSSPNSTPEVCHLQEKDAFVKKGVSQSVESFTVTMEFGSSRTSLKPSSNPILDQN